MLLFVYGFTTISAALAYALLPSTFPISMTGRVTTASNVLMFSLSFAFQWGVGAVLRLYPSSDGQYDPAGYAAAATLVMLASHTDYHIGSCDAALRDHGLPGVF